MARNWRIAGVVLLGALLIGCSTTYKPLSVDARTGLYATGTSVPPGGVLQGKEKVDPFAFGAVLLIADSNRYPSRLEFVTRRALADLGYPRVVNLQEWRAWAVDKKFALPSDDRITGQVIKDFSNTVTPVLIMEMRYGWLGDTAHLGALRLVDGRNLQSLFSVQHPKRVWMNVDDEIIYPVLNEMRKWHKDMTGPRT